MSVTRIALALVLAGTAAPALAEQITCHSTQDRPEPCGTVQPGSSVRLARQLGDRACIEGRTWGTGPDRDSIWVSSGCSAVFDVQPPGDGGNYAGNAGGYSDRDRSGGSVPDSGAHSPDWQRGFADGQRGEADPNATSQDYLEGFRAGEDTPRNDRYGSRSAPPRAPADNPGVFESVPNPPPDRAPRDAGENVPDDYANRGPAAESDRYPPRPDERYAPRGDPEPPPGNGYDTRRDERYASIDQRRDTARRACIDAAAQDRRYGADRIISRDVRWIGHGDFAVRLDTPEGELICSVDRDGNVHSIDQR